jgi:hypothetical protein
VTAVLYALTALAVFVIGYLTGRDGGAERRQAADLAHAKWMFTEQQKALRTADMVSVYDELRTANEAILKHETRLSEMELAMAGRLTRRS